ncbi:FtsW/RodA/SpoVE family cell cycle protein [Haloechinothrix halophila]|uniref:FtsW/RodA/SpoVE family cell cycle protein n=1 Tax=Haloechinothrix halophila TaxID=1069073 RepID=UPI000429CB96|nr:FtsW/RodA/SpoVE family cell cycle protein [Haloechinothrix halophila]
MRAQQDHRVTDPWLILAAAVLGGLGLLNLVSLGMADLAVRHGMFVVLGIGLLFVVSRVRLTELPRIAWTVYGIAIGLLLAVPVLGVTINGARRWLDFGLFTVQPAELAKIAVVLALATLLARSYRIGRFLLGLVIAAVPAVIVALQPNLSSAIVIGATAGLMLVLARVPLLPLLPLFGLGVAALPLAVLVLRPYQLSRVHAFLTGARDADGPGWAAMQADIAIGEGGLFGMAREPLYGLRASYLPEREHDLAFASLVHGWGLVAAIVAIAAILVLVWRCATAARLARSREAALISSGVAVLFGLHAVVSIAVNLSLMPHTGLPIPLLSYGGSTAVVHLAALGFVLAARRDGVQRPLWAPPPKRRQHPRLVRSGAFGLTVGLIGMSMTAWQLQVARGDELRLQGEHQMTRCIRLPAERGVITDTSGVPLVRNGTEYEARVVPGLFPDKDERAREQLADVVGVKRAEVDKAIREGTELSVRVGRIPPNVARQVAEAKLPGVLVVPSERRSYPYGEMLSTMLGFVGVADEGDMERWPNIALGATVGKSGLERQYDAVLRGVDGKQCVYVDPGGRPVAAAERVDPIAGHDLRLNLDLSMQRVATKALAKAVRTSPGDLGAAIVMDARTGAVKTMASVPSYDNNVYSPPVDMDELRNVGKGPGLPMFNHATQVAAPPGSTFKIVVASANMKYGALPPGQVIPTGGAYTYGGHTFNNWKPMGPHNMFQAIQWSDNVYFYKLAAQLGPQKIANVARHLGVGSPTGIDLPGEASGFLGTPKTVSEIGGHWYPGSTVLMGIGQGTVTATPLQLSRWTVGVGTGKMITPQLAGSYGGAQNIPIASTEPKRLPFANKLGPVRKGMRKSAAEGTGGQLAKLPITAMSKTGTAQDPSAPNGGTHAWFSALVPADNPQLVVTVMVRSGGYGSAVSGPVVTRILEHYLKNRD